MISRQMEFASEREMLFVEQAQAMFREMSERATAAADGTVLGVIESIAIQRGRELTCKAIEETASEQIEQAEKKGRSRGRARAAGAGTIAEKGRKTSWPRPVRSESGGSTSSAASAARARIRPTSGLALDRGERIRPSGC